MQLPLDKMQRMNNSPPASVPTTTPVLSWTTRWSWLKARQTSHPRLLDGYCLAFSWEVSKRSCSAQRQLLCRVQIWRAVATSPLVLQVSATFTSSLALSWLPQCLTSESFSEGLCGVKVPAVPGGLARDPAQHSWSETKPESPFQQHPADQEWFKYCWWIILPFTKDNSFCSLWSVTDASCILYTTVLADILPSFHRSTQPKPRDHSDRSLLMFTASSSSSLPTSYYCQVHHPSVLEVHHFVLGDRNKTKLEYSHHLTLCLWDQKLTQWVWRRKFCRDYSDLI